MIKGKTNVLTIFRVKNYVFGSYIQLANPYPSMVWINDAAAFLFSLRRNGTSNTVKLPVIESQYALYVEYRYMGFYGRGQDLFIVNQPFTSNDSFSQLGYSYSAPSGCSISSGCASSFLAGAVNGWFVDEIEAYQLS
jgi:hypothetical protein